MLLTSILETRECMATPAGVEPATYPLGGDCSIQLSYGAKYLSENLIKNNQTVKALLAI